MLPPALESTPVRKATGENSDSPPGSLSSGLIVLRNLDWIVHGSSLKAKLRLFPPDLPLFVERKELKWGVSLFRFKPLAHLRFSAMGSAGPSKTRPRRILVLASQ